MRSSTHINRSAIFCALLIFLSVFAGSAVNAQEIGLGVMAGQELEEEILDSETAAETKSDEEDLWVQEASDLGIPIVSYYRMKGVEKGFYPVITVLESSGGVSKLYKRLNRNGVDVISFIHPEDEKLYLCNSRFDSGEEALLAARKVVEKGKNTIIELLVVENEPIDPAEPFTLQTESPTSPASSVLENKTDFSEAKAAPNAIIKKADQYFEKMWYADAAELYELGLERNPEISSPEIIERVADAHYFNSDMERANFWYEKLYEAADEELSAEYLFKYSQSLKGLGKYGRARRILKLYDKKVEGTPLGRYRQQEVLERETTLDNILDADEMFAVKNLQINSEYSDFAPTFYEEDKIVYASSLDSAFFATRRYKWNEQPYLDLYVAKMNEESDELNSAVKFSKSINTKYHEAAVAFSPDHNTMYFTRNNFGKKLRRDNQGVNHLKLYRSQKVNGEWTEAEELPFNGEDYSTGHPAVSPYGKQLYFVSDRPGSMGETDIFTVDIYEDGTYSIPKNLGTQINTEQKEMFPFFTGTKLYFSSDGHTGLGGLDVFQAEFDEEEGFRDIINMGKPINSGKDDFSFIVSEETQKGYFASNRDGGKGDDDLYSFERLFPEEVNENAIAGVITDKITGDRLPDAMVELLDENNIKLKEVVSDVDGGFVFEDLDSHTKYHLRIKKDTFADKDQFLETEENNLVYTDVTMSKLEELVTIEDGIKKLKTEMIYFDFDKDTVREDAALELDKLVAVMQEYPSMVIKIASHTDSRGPKEYNLNLSDRRAKSTRDYLISQGIDRDRIESAEGFGESQLLNECDGSVRCAGDQHQRNRRSEFIIVNM
ncbi:OmpA family protein [Robiginitalea sp.]|uniref:OmpA family protein n=1 Tax=Robiginitalea sp. TaxID=1902411 RepID=UPI003C76EFCF